MEHISVLKKEVIDLLDVKEDGIYLDLTLGRAGHASEILKRLKSGFLYGFDLDKNAIKESDGRLKSISSRYELIHDNYKNFDNYLNEKNIRYVDGVLLDLGVSSPQFDDPSRGFSYRFNTPLDMRMNQDNKLDAKYIINNYSLQDLTRIFKDYGEEKDAYKIASNIVKQREMKSIDTTFDLVDIITASKSSKELSKKGHPAKQVFQALRIEVNDELNNLKELLKKVIPYLNVDGKLIIITFHSLEDRIVKLAFNDLVKVVGNREDDYNLPNREDIKFKLLNNKVITASEEELKNNHRAVSAKLRGIKRIKL